jgi:hypothetical protein
VFGSKEKARQLMINRNNVRDGTHVVVVVADCDAK